MRKPEGAPAPRERSSRTSFAAVTGAPALLLPSGVRMSPQCTGPRAQAYQLSLQEEGPGKGGMSWVLARCRGTKRHIPCPEAVVSCSSQRRSLPGL